MPYTYIRINYIWQGNMYVALLNSICLEHHVHFSGGSGLGKDNNIMIQPQRHGHIDAHLGFLQLYHRLFVI